MQLLSSATAMVLFVMVMWGGWPIVARLAGLSSIWVAIVGSAVGAAMVAVVSFAIHGMPSLAAMTGLRDVPDMRSFLVGAVAGAMLGLGMLAYSVLISNKAWEVSTLVPIAAGSITAFTAIAGILFLGESIGLMKLLGLVAVVVGIVLLS